MKHTLAFDVYGTLVNPLGLASSLEADLQKNVDSFVELWRTKQLEYSFRRALMRRYISFAECTRQALRFAAARHHWALSEKREQELMERYKHLDPFPDAVAALPGLARQHRLFAFSNGARDDVDQVLTHAGLRRFFEDVISVEDIRSFKPDPAVYAHARHIAGNCGTGFALVSSNAWDVIGARSADADAYWIRRANTALFDPWEFEPTATLGSLTELESHLSQA